MSNNQTYQCACGQWRALNESAPEAIQHEQTYHEYCGFCKQEPCLVATNQACCHDFVRYGRCTKPGHKRRNKR